MQGMDGIEFVVFDKARGWRAQLDLRRRLKGRRFPLLLHMHPSMRANLASLAISAPIRLGYDRASAKDYQYLFCNRHIASRPNRHVMDLLLDFLPALGLRRDRLRWDIPLSDSDSSYAAETIDGTRPSLLISPCAVSRFRNFRNWRADRFAEIADYAHRRYGAQVVLTGGSTPIEAQYGNEITNRSSAPLTNLIGKTTLKQLLALIARTSVVLCGDSGPAHMSTSVGTPVVGLYATTNRHRAGPYLCQHLVVDRYPEAVQREFGVAVDQVAWGQRVRVPEAMDLITVADVREKLDMAFAERDIDPVGLGSPER